MKPMIFVLGILCLLLSSCTYEKQDLPVLTPIQDVDESELMLVATKDEYMLYRSMDLFISVGVPIQLDELEYEVCSIDSEKIKNYIIKYNDSFYTLQTGIELGLYNTYELMELGVEFDCVFLNPVTGSKLPYDEIIFPLETDEFVAKIGDVEIHRDIKPRCEKLIHITVDDIYFGYFSSGCKSTLDWVGYIGKKDGIMIELSELESAGFITTAQIYTVFLEDDDRVGNPIHIRSLFPHR